MATDPIREEALFDAAVRIDDSAERAAFLHNACLGDPELLIAVEQLLACDQQTDGFLAAQPTATRVSEPQPGNFIGPYEIVRRIGEGGFGVVYLAQQRQPVSRRVAVKVIKLGMDTRRLIDRFEAERRTLAMMNHPHIATVLDVGATHSGRPYFVMEYVDGLPLDQHCARSKESTRERLGVFVQICRAVHYAHQKGIIHRDLKPANVLVAKDRQRPHVKVIDFGVAKAIGHDEITGHTITAALEFAGTPEYMSPEQVTENSDVDIRADVYALGAILYGLLAGRTPLQLSSKTKIGVADALHAIREVEPPPPSTVLLAERSLDRPPAERDLDWIALKALEKERSRRYESASELADDIERYLTHQPVLARPATRRYRAAKFVRRNRLAVAAASIVAVALATGAILATMGLMHAQRQRVAADHERAQALAEAARAEAVLQLTERLAGTLHAEHGRAANFTVRQQLDEFSATLDHQPLSRPDVESRIRRTIGRSYSSLGDAKRAGPHLQRALNLRERYHGADHPLTAQSRVDHAWYLESISRLREARQEVHSALLVLRQQRPRPEFIEGLRLLARIHGEFGEGNAMTAVAREAESVALELFGADDPRTWSCTMSVLASIRGAQPEDTERTLRTLLRRWINLRGNRHIEVAHAKRSLAKLLTSLPGREQPKRLEEAEELLRSAMKTHRELLGESSADLVRDYPPLVVLLRNTDRHDDAEAVAREGVRIAEQLTSERDLLLARCYESLARTISSQSPAEAERLWARVLSIKQPILGDHPRVATPLRLRAAALQRLGKWEEVASCYFRELDILSAHRPDAQRLVVCRSQLAEALLQLGEREQAAAQLKELAQTEMNLSMGLRVNLIDLYVSVGQFENAERQGNALASESDNSPVAVAELVKGLQHMVNADFTSAADLFAELSSRRRIRRAPRLRALFQSLHGDCLLQLGRVQQAERVWTRLADALQRRAANSSRNYQRVARRLMHLRSAKGS